MVDDTLQPGWLKRQADKIEADLATHPDWLRMGEFAHQQPTSPATDGATPGAITPKDV